MEHNKVYLVLQCVDYEGSSVLSVHTDLDRAMISFDEHVLNEDLICDELLLVERELDSTKKGAIVKHVRKP